MSDHTPRDPAKIQRQQRLEAQLRENLKRRKGQAKAWSQPKTDDQDASPETAVKDGSAEP